jgi:hypothetical protein
MNSLNCFFLFEIFNIFRISVIFIIESTLKHDPESFRRTADLIWSIICRSGSRLIGLIKIGFESESERIPRDLPRGKRANSIIFFLTDRRFPAACGGELQFDCQWSVGLPHDVSVSLEMKEGKK